MQHIPSIKEQSIGQALKGSSGIKNETDNERPIGNKLFIVHGHDEGAKQSVARFIEKLGFEPIILHEKPNAGKTVIEKFEKYADVDFAVIILTPDDLVNSKDKSDDLKERARQNVILELGYFIGKLGRDKVCVLRQGNVEIPSDILGVIYEPLDSEGGWQLKLTKEMEQAGFNVDLNKII